MRQLFASAIMFAASISSGSAGEVPTILLEEAIPELRSQIGKPLIDTVVQLNNDKEWVLEKVTPQGAFFFHGADSKSPAENFDTLRRRSQFAVSFTTCTGSKSLDSKIANIIAWQVVSDAETISHTNDRALIAAHLQRLLESVNAPAVVVTPSTMRAPKADQLRGVVFEFVKGDTTENVSVLDDISERSLRSMLRFSWQIVNNSYCPKF